VVVTVTDGDDRRCATIEVGPRQDSRTSNAVPGQRQDGVRGDIVYWLVLVLSGVLEAVWATALGRSEGFTRPAPTVVFVLALVASMAGLAYAMRGLPIGTAYAVWVGIGAALTAGYAMWSGQEPASLLRVLLLMGIIGCVIGLKVTH
jgi:quaternary ammonium compound-resistance protein SugE